MARKYKTVSCHTTKTAAKKKAAAMRKAGKTASVVKNGSKHCVKSSGNRKRK